MSAEYHKVAETYMFAADEAHRDGDVASEMRYCLSAAGWEQAALDAMMQEGVAASRPRTVAILMESRDALRERVARLRGSEVALPWDGLTAGEAWQAGYEAHHQEHCIEGNDE